jgi:hypothetical protein
MRGANTRIDAGHTSRGTGCLPTQTIENPAPKISTIYDYNADLWLGRNLRRVWVPQFDRFGIGPYSFFIVVFAPPFYSRGIFMQ